MTEFGNKIINLQALDAQTLGHYCHAVFSDSKGCYANIFSSL